MLNKNLIPSPLEHAYHLGWNAYFEKDKSNPYDIDSDNVLYLRYESGFNNATNSDKI